MIQINQLKLTFSHTEEELNVKICKTLRIPREDLLSYTIQKKSLDARKKPELYYIYQVLVKAVNEDAIKKKLKNNQIIFDKKEVHYTCNAEGAHKLSQRPVIIGTGPCGLFCGYQLALMGYRPILLEQGADVEQRVEDVRSFWESGTLLPYSNVQFGEGGAGTFSDGKLNTLVKDPHMRNAYVLETFVKCGAPKEILYESKPHIGTDVLVSVVKNMRLALEAAGGEVRFYSKASDFIFSKDAEHRQNMKAILVQNTKTEATYELPAEVVVLAIGHSSRETLETLHKKQIEMEAKSFAVGVRIEHPQDMIDVEQYGAANKGKLAAAAYKLTANASDGRGVYTFCMCPGGYVVNAASEEGRLCVNGMSYHDRAGENANSAVIVTVSPEDFGRGDALAGVAFQRKLEERAFREGAGSVPVQLLGDFKRRRASDGLGTVKPQIKGDYKLSDLHTILPDFISQALEEGITAFGRKVKGFDREDAVLSAVESRTSSPVRIIRDSAFVSSAVGLYPCGEGAGYAGGITSAAMDGLKAAEEIAKKYQCFDNDNECLRNF